VFLYQRENGKAACTLRHMAFEPVPSFVDLVELETRVLERWRDEDVFHESLRRREGAPEWVFYEGPPTANGQPGIHHVWARAFKDLYPRFHTMRGRYVARKGGWDCHGLPVEVEVEKELGISNKHQIMDFGIEAFNQRCRESVQRYVEDWSALTARIGMWIDTADAYWTMRNEYIESVWWLVRQMWDRGLIYEGTKVVPYCGRCGTALSSHELGQPDAYRDITEPSVYVRFPVVDADFDLLVWTTTPWTLVSNVAAAVGADIEYVRVKAPEGGRDLVLAATRVAEVLGDDAEVVATVPVSDLKGRHYERPFTLLPIDAGANRVVVDDFVTVEEGSGVVHLAPAFGEIDREVAEREGLPMLNPVGADARFDQSVPDFAGLFVKDADAGLIDLLAAGGKLVSVVEYTHSYPHCWRCGTPLVYWAKPTWFARTAQHKDALLRENETIGWHPEYIKRGRFGDWLENNVDWALSRDRFWGTPMPVWRCQDCNADTCVGSVAELGELAGCDLSDLDLHRPYVDDVTLTCAACSGRAARVEPVLDAWFDSGSMPSAQFHYPFEHEEVFAHRFPADFIAEAIDQTRGWFYSLLAVNTLVFDRAPYRNVVCLALIVAADGQKMSKSRGNVIDPWVVLNRRGADALRWYFFSSGSPWTTRRVSDAGIEESTNRFLLTLWNTYSFFVTYANLDRWSSEHTAPAEHVLDRWIRSRLHRTVAEVTDALEGYDALRAAQALDRLVDDLSNWYVRRSRPRFWTDSDPAAHTTLHECLLRITELLAPLCPFITDELHRNLSGRDESVHLADWPEADTTAVDGELEAEMTRARRVVSLGLAARSDAHLKVRTPLRRALVLVPEGDALDDAVIEEVRDALNVRRVELITDLEGLVDYDVVPNFARLGPRVGKLMPHVQSALKAVDGATVRRAFEQSGQFPIELEGGETVDVGPEELDVRATSHAEFALAQEGGYTVALDTTLDDELRREGLARELARRLNDLRKASGFEIADRVRVTVWADGPLADAARHHEKWIAGEVLADDWQVPGADAPAATDVERVDVDGYSAAVRLEKVEKAA
jgi:isoleucyl-tRNA synthetase